MTLRTLVTGFVTAAAGAAVVAAAAGGVTTTAAPAIAPVSWDTPLPAAPAPDLQGPLLSTLNALSAPGPFAGKGAYIQGGLRLRDSLLADSAYNSAAAKGYFPLNFVVDAIDQNGGTATANVTATAASGKVANQTVTFVAGPSPTGWQISKQSALGLVTSVG